MKVKHWFPLVILGTSLLTGCSYFDNLVYKIDIPQGNYLEQRQVDKLRVDMTREQVVYILGTPIAQGAFENNIWHYVYRYKTGKGKVFKKELTLTFVNNRLATVEGDFTLPEDYYTPLEGSDTPTDVAAPVDNDAVTSSDETAENAEDATTPPVDPDANIPLDQSTTQATTAKTVAAGPVASTTVQQTGPAYQWIIKVDSFAELEDARQLAENLTRSNFRVELLPNPPVRGTDTVVYVGPSNDMHALKNKLKAVHELLNADDAEIVDYPAALAESNQQDN